MKKNILNFFGKIQSVQFPTANNISKIHKNRRQKSASDFAGLRRNEFQVALLKNVFIYLLKS